MCRFGANRVPICRRGDPGVLVVCRVVEHERTGTHRHMSGVETSPRNAQLADVCVGKADSVYGTRAAPGGDRSQSKQSSNVVKTCSSGTKFGTSPMRSSMPFG